MFEHTRIHISNLWVQIGYFEKISNFSRKKWNSGGGVYGEEF